MSNKTLVFFSNEKTNRLIYTAELVFQDLLGLNIVFTQVKNDYLSSKLPKINYSQTPLSHFALDKREIFIKNQTLLFENQVFKKHVDLDFSFLLKQSPLQFDFLAAIFFLVSRYEEYVVDPSVFDKHNRFPAKASLAYKFGFLQKPIVNQWAMEINDHLKTLFPELKTTLPTYHFQPTFDIDMPWKYKNKGLLRTFGGFVRDVLSGNFKEFKNRFKVLRGEKDDPDYTFYYIIDLHKSHKCSPIFFLLLGDYGEFDKNPDEDNFHFYLLIALLNTLYTVGLHPSYRSNSSLNILKKEKMRFERLTRQNLRISRQHFLKLRFPRNLSTAFVYWHKRRLFNGLC